MSLGGGLFHEKETVNSAHSYDGLLGLGCLQQGEAPKESADGVITIDFWAAPNPPQQAYWMEMAKEYEAVNPNVKINVSAIKESPSSEASIRLPSPAAALRPSRKISTAASPRSWQEARRLFR